MRTLGLFLCLGLYFSLAMAQNSTSYTLHGEIIKDKYLWMENPSMISTLIEWKEKELSFTKAKISNNENFARINHKIMEISQKNSESKLPYKKGAYYYEIDQFRQLIRYECDRYENYESCRNNAVIVYNKSNPIEDFFVSENNKYIAILASIKGSDKRLIYFADMEKNVMMQNTINGIETNISDNTFYWKDNSGLFYKKGEDLYCYNLKTNKDSVIEKEIRQFEWDETTSSLIIQSSFEYEESHESVDSLIVYNFQSFPYPRKGYILENGSKYKFLGSIGGELFFHIKKKNAISEIWKQNAYSFTCLINKNANIKDAYLLGNQIIGLRKNENIFDVYDKKGNNEKSISARSNVEILRANNDILVYKDKIKDKKFHYLNFLNSDMITKTIQKNEYEDYKEENVYFLHGGEKICIKLLYAREIKKLIDKKETVPTLLWGYGGFGLNPEDAYRFNEGFKYWLLQGGVVAIVYTRGGANPKDSLWHEKGKKSNKQNAIDDFIAAARFLTKQGGITKKEKLVAFGYSHGAFLVAAAMAQTPEVFGAVVLENGLYDMLRYDTPAFQSEQNLLWADEFGVSHNIQDFEVIKKISPYYQLNPNFNYPPTLIVTAVEDDRVSSLHSYKFKALLSEFSPENKYLYEKKGGHKSSLFPDDRINTETYKYAFIFQALNLKVQEE